MKFIRLMRFFSPEGGGGGGGDEPTPFDGIDLEHLEEAERSKIEKARTDFLAQRNELRTAKTQLDTTTQTTAQLEAKLREVQGKIEKATRGESNQDQWIATIRSEFEKAGFKPDQIEVMLPMWTKILSVTKEQTKSEVGTDLAPFAMSTIAREAESAYNAVMHDDPLGLLQDANVAQVVWNTVEDRVKRGMATNQDVVRNLARMAYMDQIEGKKRKGEDVTPMITKITTAQRAFGTAPNLTNNPPSDPNAAKTTLNDDTRNALAETFRVLGAAEGIYPKDFKPQTKSKLRTA